MCDLRIHCHDDNVILHGYPRYFNNSTGKKVKIIVKQINSDYQNKLNINISFSSVHTLTCEFNKTTDISVNNKIKFLDKKGTQNK